MRKVFITVIVLFITGISVFAQEGVVLKGGVSIDKVPKTLYGEWRVSSRLLSTNNYSIFKDSSVDLWNLSRVGNVITLDNPFSGAKASIVVDKVEGNLIKFKKTGNYDGKILLDVVQLTLKGDSFWGTNYLELKTIINGKVVKKENASYKIYGEKIAGSNLVK